MMIFLLSFCLASDAQREWTIMNSYAIPEGASGLAHDGNYIYFGIYGVDGDHVYRFDMQDGSHELLFESSILEDAFGLTYVDGTLWSIKQIGSSSPSLAVQLDFNGNQINQITFDTLFKFYVLKADNRNGYTKFEY